MFTIDDFERIAIAIRVQVEDVVRLTEEFSNAALWYRISKKPPKRISPSALKIRLGQVSIHIEKLQKALGFDDPSHVIDGPDDPVVLQVLTSHFGPDETDVLRAADRIARLNEICSGILAASDLHVWLANSSERAVKVSKSTKLSGHLGDLALNEWIASMMSIYEQLTGHPVKRSTIAPGRPGAGKATGRAIRFLEAAARPIGVEMSADAWSERIRAIRKRKASEK